MRSKTRDAPAPEQSGLRALLRGPSGEQVLVITGVTAATQMVWGVLVPVLPAFATSMGIDPGRIGLLIAGFGIGRVLANIPAGFLGRRIDRSRLFLGGALGVVLFSALCGLVDDFGWLLALRVLTGIAGGVTMTSGQSLLVDVVDPRSRARAMSFLQGLQLAGGSVGPALGGFVATYYGLRAPFFVSGAVCLAFVCWVLIRRSLRASLSSVHHRAPAVEDSQPRATRSFMAACVVGFAVFFSRFGIQQTLLPLIAYQAIGLSVSELGLVFSGVALLNIVCVLFLGGLSDRVGRKRVIATSMLAVAAAASAFALPLNTLGFVAVVAAFGLATSIGGPVPAAYVADVVRGQRRGPAIGVYRTCGDLAGILGPILIGFAISWHGFLAAILVSVAVNLVAALIFAVAARETVPKCQR
jgi:DHA1 family multidrug resistance protein-like MFS transporter